MRKGLFASPFNATYGMFDMPGPCGERLVIVASDAQDPSAQGWEHVSVSTKRRLPNWTEMAWVKSLFWDAEDAIIEFHPPASVYVNNMTNCLHLWKPPYEVVLPPSILVGLKDAELGHTPTGKMAVRAPASEIEAYLRATGAMPAIRRE